MKTKVFALVAMFCFSPFSFAQDMKVEIQVRNDSGNTVRFVRVSDIDRAMLDLDSGGSEALSINVRSDQFFLAYVNGRVIGSTKLDVNQSGFIFMSVNRQGVYSAALKGRR